jgi:hypothetical protein
MGNEVSGGAIYGSAKQSLPEVVTSLTNIAATYGVAIGSLAAVGDYQVSGPTLLMEARCLLSCIFSLEEARIFLDNLGIIVSCSKQVIRCKAD